MAQSMRPGLLLASLTVALAASTAEAATPKDSEAAAAKTQDEMAARRPGAKGARKHKSKRARKQRQRRRAAAANPPTGKGGPARVAGPGKPKPKAGSPRVRVRTGSHRRGAAHRLRPPRRFDRDDDGGFRLLRQRLDVRAIVP